MHGKHCLDCHPVTEPRICAKRAISAYCVTTDELGKLKERMADGWHCELCNDNEMIRLNVVCPNPLRVHLRHTLIVLCDRCLDDKRDDCDPDIHVR